MNDHDKLQDTRNGWFVANVEDKTLKLSVALSPATSTISASLWQIQFPLWNTKTDQIIPAELL